MEDNSSDLYHNFSLTRDEELAKLEIGILGTVFALALLGNVSVLSVLLWRRKKVITVLESMAHGFEAERVGVEN